MAHQGVVSRVVHQGERTGLEINGQWYSLFEPCDVQEGDHVEFDYKTVKKNGKTYHNIQTIKRIAASTNEVNEAERIARAVALKAAVQSCTPESAVEEVLDVAQDFLDFLLNRSHQGAGDDR